MVRKKSGLATLAALAVALVFAMTFAPRAALARTTRTKPKAHAAGKGDPQVMFWNDENGDAEIHFINPTEFDLCLNFYVFDDAEELAECCSTDISSNGFCEADQEIDLIANPANGRPLGGSEGLYEGYPSQGPFLSGSSCDAGSPYQVFGEIDAWYDVVQESSAGVTGVIQNAFTEATLDPSNLVFVQDACFAIESLLSGTGSCFLPC